MIISGRSSCATYERTLHRGPSGRVPKAVEIGHQVEVGRVVLDHQNTRWLFSALQRSNECAALLLALERNISAEQLGQLLAEVQAQPDALGWRRLAGTSTLRKA